MIFEIIIIILIGKQFFQLAKKYNQKLGLVYAVLGVVSYYGGAFIAGVIIGFFIEFAGSDPLAGVNDLTLALIFIPIGLFFCWGTYQLLKNKWHREYVEEERNKPKISDIGKSAEDDASIENLKNLGKNNDGDWRF